MVFRVLACRNLFRVFCWMNISRATAAIPSSVRWFWFHRFEMSIRAIVTAGVQILSFCRVNSYSFSHIRTLSSLDDATVWFFSIFFFWWHRSFQKDFSFCQTVFRCSARFLAMPMPFNIVSNLHTHTHWITMRHAHSNCIEHYMPKRNISRVSNFFFVVRFVELFFWIFAYIYHFLLFWEILMFPMDISHPFHFAPLTFGAHIKSTPTR